MFKPVYHVTVKFADASGLLKGSDVYLAGAVIGKVTTDPLYIPEKQEVEVHLKIDQNVKIRQDASYVIGDSGLLGDRFVVVKPEKVDRGKTDESPYMRTAKKSRARKSRGCGHHEIVEAADRARQPHRDAARRHDHAPEYGRFAEHKHGRLEGDDPTLRHMVDNGDKMIANANDLLLQAKDGKGVIGRLINDRKLADNIATFIANLKAHGPVFYHDDTGDSDRKRMNNHERTPQRSGGGGRAQPAHGL